MVSLLVVDFAALYAAVFIALMVKAVLRDGEWAWHASSVEASDTIAFAYLVTVLLFARSGMYAERAQRPGLPRIVTSLFQVTLVALIFALVNGEQYSSYYIFYGTLAFAILTVGLARDIYERVTGVLLRAAGYRRRAVLVGSGKHIEDVAHALIDEVHAPVEMVGFISLTPRPDNGLRSLGQIDDLPEVLVAHRVQEVIIADPDFPEERAVELVDQCHQRGVTVRIAPSTMEILVHRAEFVPGATVPLFELRPPVFDGFDYLLKRTFDFFVSLLLVLLLSPLLLAIAIAVFVSSRGPVLYRSIRPGIGGEPFSCFKFRTMRSDADQLQADLESENEASGALFKIRDDPRLTRVGRFLRRYSLDELPQLFNVIARADVARRPAAAAAARLRPARGVAQEALPRAAGRDRPVAGLRARGAGLRRPRAARLPLPRALVDRARPLDPDQDRARRAAPPRRLLVLGCRGRACSPWRRRATRRTPIAVSIARAGSRPAGSAAERRAHERMARTFRAAGLSVRVQRFATARGRSRNVIGRFDGPGTCLRVIMAHTDSMPAGPGAEDNASGLGVLSALAPRLRGALRRVAGRHGRRGAALHGLARPPGRPRAGADRAARAAALRALARRGRHQRPLPPALAGRRAAPRGRARARGSAWQRDSDTGNSDHREFELAGMRGVKLGVRDNPCRHMACDTPDRLRKGAFRAAMRVVLGVLR